MSSIAYKKEQHVTIRIMQINSTCYSISRRINLRLVFLLPFFFLAADVATCRAAWKKCNTNTNIHSGLRVMSAIDRHICSKKLLFFFTFYYTQNIFGETPTNAQKQCKAIRENVWIKMISNLAAEVTEKNRNIQMRRKANMTFGLKVL